jgi:hypothetical protein
MPAHAWGWWGHFAQNKCQRGMKITLKSRIKLYNLTIVLNRSESFSKWTDPEHLKRLNPPITIPTCILDRVKTKWRRLFTHFKFARRIWVGRKLYPILGSNYLHLFLMCPVLCMNCICGKEIFTLLYMLLWGEALWSSAIMLDTIARYEVSSWRCVQNDWNWWRKRPTRSRIGQQ